MKFYQKYVRTEYQYGKQIVLFVLADNYSEIFQETGFETQIFLLDNIKQDLNLSETKFAVDALEFGVNQATCVTDTDKNALAFTLECKTKFRVCAVFFLRENEVPSNDNLLFLGQINNKLSGDDLMWNSLPFGTLINPIREYKFTALSLDISLLEKCLLTGKCYNEDAVKIPNIYDRMPEVFLRAINIKEQFSFALWSSHWTGNDVGIFHLESSCKLSDAIELFLSRAALLIKGMYDIDIKLNLQASDLGLQVSPVQYEIEDARGKFSKQSVVNNQLYNLHLNIEETASKKEPWINIRMVEPNYVYPVYEGSGANPYADPEAIKEQIAAEKPFSFKNFESVAELLFAIAKAFNCYLVSSYAVDDTGLLNINIEFKSRLNLTESSNTYLIGAKDASFDTSATISNEANSYYSQANQYVSDGNKSIEMTSNFTEIKYNKTEELEKAIKQRSDAKERYKTEFTRLVLSTSQTLIQLNQTDTFLPINTYPQPIWSYYKDFINPYLITNALYINCAIPEQQQRDIILAKNLGYAECIRPIGKVYGKIDGVAVKDELGEGVQLADFVNTSLGHEKTFYETEYEITVPFWNGFSKSFSGTECSWKNIKLGSIVELNEDIRIFVNGVWQVFRPAKGAIFPVVSKEMSLSKPETKLKLQNIGRFAYSIYYEGKEGELLSSDSSSLWAKSEPVEDLSNYKAMEIAEGEIILIGDAVMKDVATNTARKSIAQKIYRNQLIGIAKLIRNNIVYYQDGGVIEDENYNFEVGKNVFVRTAPTTADSNISQLYVGADRSNGDNLMIRIGRAETEKSFTYIVRELGLE